MTALRLVYCFDNRSPHALRAHAARVAAGESAHRLPSLLVAFPYLARVPDKSDERATGSLPCRSWVLDSGAFTAFSTGKPVDLGLYIETCREVMRSPFPPSEIFALDVIGDWRASLRNVETMWKAGVPALPTYHYGEPPEVLRDVAASADKIALGGMKHLHGSKKLKWAEQCMARIWPKKVHALALAEESVLMKVPFHSADASSWIMGPMMYGRWARFKGASLRTRYVNLDAELEHYLDVERRVVGRWAKSFRELGWVAGDEGVP